MSFTNANLALPANIVATEANEAQIIHHPLLAARYWCGRSVSSIHEGASIVANSLLKVVQTVFSSIHHLFTDTPTAASILRKFDAHVLRFIEHLSNSKGKLRQFADFIKHNVAVIDFVQLADDIHYFVSGRFKEKRNEKGEIEKLRDNNFVISGKLAFFVADTGGALYWLNEMGFISLSKAAAAIGELRIFSLIPKVISCIPVLRNLSGLQKVAETIGNLRVFSFVNKFNCLSVTLRAIDLGYALFAIDAGRRLINADNKFKTISASLDLSCYLSELVLSAIVFAGVTNIIALGTVGVACITLVVSSFLYRLTHEKELKQTLQLFKKEVVALK